MTFESNITFSDGSHGLLVEDQAAIGVLPNKFRLNTTLGSVFFQTAGPYRNITKTTVLIPVLFSDGYQGNMTITYPGTSHVQFTSGTLTGKSGTLSFWVTGKPQTS
jgi:hypothetical protein